MKLLFSLLLLVFTNTVLAQVTSPLGYTTQKKESSFSINLELGLGKGGAKVEGYNLNTEGSGYTGSISFGFFFSNLFSINYRLDNLIIDKFKSGIFTNSVNLRIASHAFSIEAGPTWGFVWDSSNNGYTRENLLGYRSAAQILFLSINKSTFGFEITYTKEREATRKAHLNESNIEGNKDFHFWSFQLILKKILF